MRGGGQQEQQPGIGRQRPEPRGAVAQQRPVGGQRLRQRGGPGQLGRGQAGHQVGEQAGIAAAFVEQRLPYGGRGVTGQQVVEQGQGVGLGQRRR